jgi:hypothetical protein
MSTDAEFAHGHRRGLARSCWLLTLLSLFLALTLLSLSLTLLSRLSLSLCFGYNGVAQHDLKVIPLHILSHPLSGRVFCVI